MSEHGHIKDGHWVPLPPIMTVESLLSYGFREWPVGQHDKHDRHWQFCKRDEKGKKLYVTVRLWAFSKYSNAQRTVQDSFDAEVQFDMNGPKTFNVSISVNDMTPGQVVDWFEFMHDKMGCTHYELNDGSDDESRHFNCDKCGRYLSPEEASLSSLCPGCKYESESGFKQVARKIKRRRI